MEFGEHPEDAMIREVHEETGLIVSSRGLLRVESERFDFENQDFHALRFYYRAVSAGGTLTHEVCGSTDLCEWIPLHAVGDLPAVPIVQRGIDLIA